jgi:hypothetical protein
MSDGVQGYVWEQWGSQKRGLAGRCGPLVRLSVELTRLPEVIGHKEVMDSRACAMAAVLTDSDGQA